jgi:hypothetical protein
VVLNSSKAEAAVCMKKKTGTILAFALVVIVGTMCVQGVFAASLFTLVLGAEECDESGWCAGYVVYGQSGTYTFQISANSNEASFPISNVKVIVSVSDDAATGGLESLWIESTQITTFTEGPPTYYGASGDPFQEPDYYGYNDQYIIPTLTYEEGHWPDNAKELTVTLTFSQTATTSSKVLFLCYGTTATGKGLKTAFSNGTLFVVPEFPIPLVAIGASFAAYAVFKKINR